MQTYLGLPVVISANAQTGPYEDWTRVRSPGRARRRRPRHRQNIRIWWKPAIFMIGLPPFYHSVIIHPDLAAELEHEQDRSHATMRRDAVAL